MFGSQLQTPEESTNFYANRKIGNDADGEKDGWIVFNNFPFQQRQMSLQLVHDMTEKVLRG